MPAGRGRGEFNYYGTADATAWFLVVLASLDDRALRDELEDAWRGAGGWLAGALDRGGGLVRHAPTAFPGGLVQQGWRDSHDPADGTGGGILHADGRVPGPRLADADTQAVTYAGCGRSPGSIPMVGGTSGPRRCRRTSRPRSDPR